MPGTPPAGDGSDDGSVTTGTDASELASLQDSHAMLRDLHRVATERDRSFEERLQGFLEVGRRRLDVDNAYLSSIDVETGEYQVVESVGPGDVEDGMSVPLSSTYCRRVIDDDEMVVLEDAESDPAWEDDVAVETYGMSCYVGRKVTVDGELYGTVCFTDADSRESFTDDEMTLTEVVVDWIERELEREEFDRERRILRQSLEEADAAVVLTDPAQEDNPIVYANRGFQRLTGYEESELLGRNCRLFQGEDTDEDAVARLATAVEEERSVTQILRNYRKDGSAFWNQVQITPITDDDGEVIRFLGSQRDVTDQVERETVLASLLARTEALMDAETKADVATAATRSIGDVLDFRGVIRLYDDDAGSLRPAATTGVEPDELDPIDPGESVAGRAFEAGETVEYPTDVGDATGMADDEDVAGGYVVPVGNHGTLGFGSTDADELRSFERRVAELLGSLVEARLDRAERQRQLRRYEEVVEVGQDQILVLDGEDRVSLATERLAAHLGYDRQEVEGTDARRLLADDCRSRVMRTFEEMVADPDRQSATLETRMLAADGTELPVELAVSLREGDDYNGAVVVVRDIAELAETRAELSQERDRFHRLFENLPDPVNEVEFVDGEPVIRAVNEAFEERFGYDAADLEGNAANDFVLPPEGLEDAVPSTNLDEAVSDGEIVTAEVRRETTDGPRDFLFRGIPLAEEGTVRAFGIYTDITEQQRRERRLQVLNRVLRHNMRNRMTVVDGYADLIANRLADGDAIDEGTERGELRKAARELRSAAADVSTLAQQARRAESIAQRPLAETDPVEMVRTAVDDADVPVEALKLRATVDGAPAVRVPGGFELAVEHLVENAVEHNDRDDPTVRVTVEATAEDPYVRIRVADDGPGIPDEEAAIITGDSEITQLTHGSGLGLWVVRWLVEAAGGSIEFAERDPRGTVATIRLRAS